jgi:hypothetical protein
MTKRIVVITTLLACGYVLAGSRLNDTPKDIERLNGSPQYKETFRVLADGGRNATALTGGETLLLVPDGGVNCRARTTSSGGASSTNGVPVANGEKFYLTLKSTETYVHCASDEAVGVTADGGTGPSVTVWTME